MVADRAQCLSESERMGQDGWGGLMWRSPLTDTVEEEAGAGGDWGRV